MPCMNTRFVTVPRQLFEAALQKAGFAVDTVDRSGNELVYIRQHDKDPTMFVKIYTSLPASGGDTRANGADAIRVLLIFRNPRSGRSGCLFKAPRVLRTGSPEAVVARTIGRAREAWAEGNRRAAR